MVIFAKYPDPNGTYFFILKPIFYLEYNFLDSRCPVKCKIFSGLFF